MGRERDEIGFRNDPIRIASLSFHRSSALRSLYSPPGWSFLLWNGFAFHVRSSTLFSNFSEKFLTDFENILVYVEENCTCLATFWIFSLLLQIEQSTRNFQIARVFYDAVTPTYVCKAPLDLSSIINKHRTCARECTANELLYSFDIVRTIVGSAVNSHSAEKKRKTKVQLNVYTLLIANRRSFKR